MKKSTVIIVSVLFGIMVFALLAVLAVNVIFSVRSIEVEGNTRYSDDLILEAVGLEKGDIIFFADEKKYASRLAKKCPYVYAVKLTKDYPSVIRLTITEEIPGFYFESSGQTGVVSKSGKVLYLGNGLPEEYTGLTKVALPGISLAMTGYPLVLNEKADNQALNTVLQAIERHGFSDRIAYITVNSRFDIRMQYDDRFLILFGDSSDFDIKLRFVNGIIEELKPEQKGTINVKDSSKGYLILDE